MSPAARKVLRPFWRQVTDRMAELHLTQQALAERMNVKRPYVTRLLSGSINISFGAAHKIAKALNMDFNYSLEPAKSAG